jgi:hypothetical protein
MFFIVYLHKQSCCTPPQTYATGNMVFIVSTWPMNLPNAVDIAPVASSISLLTCLTSTRNSRLVDTFLRLESFANLLLMSDDAFSIWFGVWDLGLGFGVWGVVWGVGCGLTLYLGACLLVHEILFAKLCERGGDVLDQCFLLLEKLVRLVRVRQEPLLLVQGLGFRVCGSGFRVLSRWSLPRCASCP